MGQVVYVVLMRLSDRFKDDGLFKGVYFDFPSKEALRNTVSDLTDEQYRSVQLYDHVELYSGDVIAVEKHII